MSEFSVLDEKIKRGKASDEDENRYSQLVPLMARKQIEPYMKMTDAARKELFMMHTKEEISP